VKYVSLFLFFFFFSVIFKDRMRFLISYSLYVPEMMQKVQAMHTLLCQTHCFLPKIQG